MIIRDIGMKKWQAWEEDLLISSYNTGKSYGEVSQQIPDRSEASCRKKLHKLLKSGKHNLARFLEIRQFWDDWEDELIITNYDAGKSWKEISKLLRFRTWQAVSRRWTKCLETRVQRRHGWSEEEDQLLIDLHRAGEGWAEIAQKIPNRSKTVCTSRWQNLARRRPGLTRGGRWKCRWTRLEKEKLVSLVNAIGPRFSDIATELPGRTAEACELSYPRFRAEISGTSGLSREDWLSSWDSNLLFRISRISLKIDQANESMLQILRTPKWLLRKLSLLLMLQVNRWIRMSESLPQLQLLSHPHSGGIRLGVSMRRRGKRSMCPWYERVVGRSVASYSIESGRDTRTYGAGQIWHGGTA